MSSLVDLYYEFLNMKSKKIGKKLQPRSGIIETLENIENGHNVILRAPTAYGKTTITEILATALVQKKLDIASRLIHVLPYRAIVQDLYDKLTKDDAEILKLNKSIVGAQDMDYHDSPFFAKKVNITTLDTFVLNLFKLPAAEFRFAFKNQQSHFEFPRAMIYSSIVLFDEFHLFGEEGKPLSAGIAAINALKEAGVPIVVMSATIDNKLEELLEKYLGDVKVVEAKDYNVRRNITVDICEKEEELFDLVKKKLNEEIIDEKTGKRRKKRVLIVFNTRAKAINVYNKLKKEGLSPLLIHSKFNRIDRTRKVDEIRSGRANLVISTQVIEAGIDTSFDVLITEAAPSHNLIQRAGRVARYGGEGEIYIFPFSKESKNIYDENEVNETINKVKSEKVINEKILLERNYEDEVNKKLIHDLGAIDNYVFTHTGSVVKLYKELCSLTRDVGLVLGFPPPNVNDPECPNKNDPKCAVPLTEDEAIKIIEKEKDNAFVCENDQCEKDKVNIKSKYCLEIQFISYNILGVRIPDYNSETGAKLPGDKE